MKKNNIHSQPDTVQTEHLSRRHFYIIIVLIVIILAALIAHTILRPDRNATLRIIYTSDMQGQITYSDGQYAGYEKVAALSHKLSSEGDHVLLLDAGNCLGDSVIAEMDNGQSILSLMNTMQYDAMVPGPMDFVYGADTLSSLRSKASFPFLAANITKADGSTVFENYKILNINSVRIGVIGVTTGLSQTQAQKSSLTVADPVETVKNVLGQMSGKTDAVIVLAYTGSEDITNALAAIDGVSIVIESGASEAFANTTDNGTVITSAGTKGNVIGVVSLDITRSDVSADSQFYTASDYSSLPAEQSAADEVASVVRSADTNASEPAGSITLPTDIADDTADSESDTSDETADTLEDGSADNDVRTYHLAETGIGNLTADAMLDAAASDGAVVALMPDQSISGTLANGIVSKGQVQNLFDDQLYLVTCKMTGGDLRTALEKSFDNYPNADGFLQVSGISYTFNASTAIGSRLSDIMIDGHKLDDARTYIVATTNILADTLGYRSEATGRIGTYRTIASVVTDYIQKNSSAASGSALPSETESDTEDTTVSSETADTTRIQINE